MQDDIYSSIAFLAMAIHLIINFKLLVRPPTAASHEPRILVADDTKINQVVLKAMFAKLGVKDMTFADNGREALKVYLFTAEVEMKDTYASKGFDGVLLKPANLNALKGLLS